MERNDISANLLVSIGRLAKAFSLKTIQGRASFIAMCSFLALFVFTTIILIQNIRTNNSIKQSVEVRVPVVNAVNNIVMGVYKASNAQRGFMLTFDERLREEREATWAELIEPNLSNLRATAEHYPNERNLIAKIDSLDYLIIQLKTLQSELDDYIINTSAKFNSSIVYVDSSEVFNSFVEIKREQDIQATVARAVSQKLIPLQNKIKAVLSPMVRSEENSLEVEFKNIEEQLRYTNIFTIISAAFFSVLLLSLSISVVRTTRNSIRGPIEQLNKLAMGELPPAEKPTEDEFGQIVKSANQVIKNISRASQYALNIGEGKFDSTFTAASDKDSLGNALMQMSEKLQAGAEEDRKRNWVTEGLAKFVDILRSGNTDIQNMSHQIISTLVRYTEANQGGLYIINDDIAERKTIDLIACFAYNKRKYIEKSFEVNELIAEGLIGQAYLEKEPIYLRDIPNEYITITSGLGEANPKFLLIVPLKVNDIVEGIIELASFREFEQYQIDFVDKLGESIASTVIAAKTNDRTRRLLYESQMQAEALRSQEEEMRQNMEELTATQEEMQRKQLELMHLQERLMEENEKQQDMVRLLQDKEDSLKAVIDNTSDLIISIDSLYGITVYNEAAKKSIESGAEVKLEKGKNYVQLQPPAMREYHKNLCDRALSGEQFTTSETVTAIDGSERYFEVSYNPIRNSANEIMGVSIFAKDVTELKLFHQKMVEQLQQEKKNSDDRIERQKMAIEKMMQKQQEKEKVLFREIEDLKRTLEEYNKNKDDDEAAN